jgi:uncharacterized membrane protein YsdA (DUF1294 family)
MNPDFSRWLVLWMVMCVALYFGIGYFIELNWVPRLLLTTNFVTFTLVLLDKIAASARMRRIPEKVLYVATFFGGSIGMLVGMFTIRHKSRKTSFQFVVGVLVLLQIVILLWYVDPTLFTSLTNSSVL